MKKITLILSLCFAILIGGVHLFIYPNYIIPASKVWRHGGGEPQNEMASVLKSLESGYKGFELNIILKNGKLILRKDKNDLSTSNEELEEVFEKVKELDTQFWIDLKPVENKDVGVVASLLEELFEKDGIKFRSFIETKSLLLASFLRIKGIPVVLWFEEKPDRVKNFVYEILFSMVKTYFKINFISHDIRNSNYKYLKNYNGEKILFTINNEELSKQYCDERVKIILTDLSFDAQKKMLKDCSALQK